MLICLTIATDKEQVTKTMLDETIDAILEGMSKWVSGLESKMNTHFDNVENRVESLRTELRYVKDEVDGLKADFCTTHSRREFQELKVKVEKH